MPPLRAYSLDILGSMSGIALFTVLSAAGTPPLVWFLVLALIAPGLAARERALARSAVTAASLVGVVLVVAVTGGAEPDLVAVLPDRRVRRTAASRRST